jgi:uncharacterized protein (TIRG00374 family)
MRRLLPFVTLALLAVFAFGIDWSQAWNAVVRADPVFLAVATIANLLSIGVKGIRWWLFLESIGVRGVGRAVRATLAGAALNNVVIANGGDAARVAGMARRGNVSSAAVLATLAVDRFCDLITYAVLFAVAALVLPLPQELAAWRVPGFVTLGVLATMAGLVVWRRSPSGDGRGIDASEARQDIAVSGFRGYLQRLIATSASVVTGPRIALAIVLSFAAWGGQWATFHYAARATAFPMSVGQSLLALLVVNASFAIRLTPGNVGVFQLLYALAAASAGLDKDRAVAVAFLVQLIQFVPITIIGLLFAPSLAKPGQRALVPIAAATAQPEPTLGVQRDRGGNA